jgi:hypothetical protein
MEGYVKLFDERDVLEVAEEICAWVTGLNGDENE